MSVTNQEIFNACLPVLRNAHLHAHGMNERCFLTAYQIWIILREQNEPICQQLTNEYGNAVGRGGGSNVGPAQRIAQALGHSEQIDTHYLDTKRILFHTRQIQAFGPSGQDCGLFRLRE